MFVAHAALAHTGYVLAAMPTTNKSSHGSTPPDSFPLDYPEWWIGHLCILIATCFCLGYLILGGSVLSASSPSGEHDAAILLLFFSVGGVRRRRFSHRLLKDFSLDQSALIVFGHRFTSCVFSSNVLCVVASIFSF